MKRIHLLKIFVLGATALIAQHTPTGNSFVNTGNRNEVIVEFTGEITINSGTPSEGLAVQVDEVSRTITNVTEASEELTITLSSPVSAGANVVVTYDNSGSHDNLQGPGSNVIASFTEYIFTPITFPTPSEPNIGTSADIILTFDTLIRNIDNSIISLANVSSAVTIGTTETAGCPDANDVAYTAFIDTDNYQQIIIDPDADLSPSTTYYAELDPTVFEYGIPDQPLVDEVGCFSFTTAASAGPVFTGGTPSVAGNENGVGFELVYRLDQAALVYYMVLDNNENFPVPTPNEIVDAEPEEGEVIVSGSVLYSPSGGFDTTFVPITLNDYDLFVVAQSFPSNIFSAVDSITDLTDITPPVATFDPADISTPINPDTEDLTITFNEDIRRLDNTAFNNTSIDDVIFVTKDSVDGPAQTVNASITGDKVITIDIASLVKDGSTFFYGFDFSTRGIEDNRNNAYAGDTVRFRTVDEVVPAATIYPPNASTVNEDTILYITFSEPVRKGDGVSLNDSNVDALVSLKLDNVSGANVGFNAQINDTKDTISVVPNANLNDGQEYYFAFTNLEDLSGNPVVDGNVTFLVLDNTNPTVDIVPTSGITTFLPDDSVLFIFSEPVRRASDGANLDDASIDAFINLYAIDGSSVTKDVTISATDDTVWITSPDLLSNKTYRAVLLNGLEDAAGNAAVVDSTTFTTIDFDDPALAVSISQLSETNATFNVQVDEIGTIYYAGFTSPSSVTDTADIANGTGAITSGSKIVTFSEVNTQISQPVSPLGSLNDEVDVYFFIRDANGNASAIQSVDNITLGGVQVTAPASPVEVCLSDSYQALGTITIAERNVFDFANSSGSLVSVIFSAPNGFEFNPSSGSLNLTGGDFSGAGQLLVSATSFTVKYATNKTSNLDQLEITGLQVRSTDNFDNVSILRSGGDAIQLGNRVADARAFGELVSLAAPSFGVAASDETICFGETVQIGQAANAGDNATLAYAWTGAALSNSSIAQPDANPGSTTNYSVTVTDGNGCFVTDALTVTVNPLPPVSLVSDDADDEICAEEPIQFTANPASGVSYDYRINGVNVGSSRIYTTSSLTQDTTVTVFVENTITNCQSSASIALIVNPRPSVDFETTDGTFSYPLGGEQDTLVGIVNGAVNSSGLFTGTGVSDSFFIPNLIAVEGNYDVTYTFTDANGCTNDRTRSIEIFDPASSVIINGDPLDLLSGSYCVDAGIIPQLDITDDVKSSLPSTSAPTSRQYSSFALLTTSGTTVTGAFGGLNGRDLNINAVPPGDYVIRYFYTYNIFNGFISFPIVGFVDVQDLRINPLPVPVINPTVLPFYCEDNTTTVNLSGVIPPGGDGRFDLYYGGVRQETDINSFNPNTLSTTYGLGSYRLWYIAQNNTGCDDSTSLDFSIFPQPNKTTIVDDTIKYCFSPTALANNLTVNGTQPVTSWYEGQTNFNNGTAAASGSSRSFNPSLSLNVGAETIDRFFVTQTSADGCESEPLQVTVYRYPQVSKPTLSASDFSCQFTPLTSPVQVTGGDPLDSIAWYSAFNSITKTLITPIANNKVPTNSELGIDLNAPGINTFYATKVDYVSADFNGCESDTATIKKTILAKPSAPVAVNPAPYCDDNSINTATIDDLLVTAESGASYSWFRTKTDTSVRANQIATLAPGNVLNTTISNDLPDEQIRLDTTFYVVKYLYEGTASLPQGCASSPDSVQIIINPTPLNPVTTDPAPYCNQIGPIADLTAASDSSNATFNWYSRNPALPGSSLIGTSTNATSFNSGLLNENATQAIFDTTFYVTQVHANGCEGQASQVQVTINPTPLVPELVATSLESCQFLDLSSFEITTGTNVRWYTTADLSNEITGSIADTQNPESSAELGLDSTLAVSTNFYITQTQLGCEGQVQPLSYTVNPRPANAVIPQDSVYSCQFQTISPIAATSQVGLNYRWYATNGLIIPIENQAIIAPLSVFPLLNQSAGNSPLWVTQTSAKGCESLPDSVYITVFPKPSPPVLPEDSVFYCSGEILQELSATGENIQWYNASNAIVANGNAFTPTNNTVITGNNDLSIEFSATQTTNKFGSFSGCESDPAEVINQVYRRPPLPSNTASFKYCVDDIINPLQAQLSDPVSILNSEIQWFTGTDTTAVSRIMGISDETAPTATEMGISNLIDSIYRFSVRQARFGCAGNPITTITVEVNGRPGAPVLTTYDSTACFDASGINISVPGTNVTIYNDAALTNIKQFFTSGSSFTQFNTSAETPSVNKDSIVFYYATQTTNLDVPGGGCEGPSLEIPFYFFKKPELLAISAIDSICHNPDSADIYERQVIASNAIGDVQWSTIADFSSNVIDDDTLTLSINNQQNADREIIRYARQEINGCLSDITSKNIQYLRIAELGLGQIIDNPAAGFDPAYCVDIDSIFAYRFKDDTLINDRPNNGTLLINGQVISGRSLSPSLLGVGTQNLDFRFQENGCISRIERSFAINPEPGAPAAANPDPICFDANAPRIAVTGDVGGSLTVYNEPSLNTQVTFSNGSFTSERPGEAYRFRDTTFTYYATQTILGCESDPEVIEVTYYRLPESPAITVPDAVCYDQNFVGDTVITLNADLTYDSIEWASNNSFSAATLLFDASGYASDQSEVLFTAIQNSNATRSIEYFAREYFRGCVSAPASSLVQTRGIAALSLSPLPDDPNEDFDPSYCLDQDSISVFRYLDGSPIKSAANKGDLFVDDSVLINRDKILPLDLGEGSHTLSLILNQDGCLSSIKLDPFEIIGDPPIPIASDPAPACFDANPPVISVVGTNITVYNDSLLSNSLLFNNIQSNFTADSPEEYSRFSDTTFNYFVTQTVSGCESDPLHLNVVYHRLPGAPNIVSPAAICFDQNLISDDTVILLSAIIQDLEAFDEIQWASRDDFRQASLLFDESGFPEEETENLYTAITNINTTRNLEFFARQVYRGCLSDVVSRTITFQGVPELTVGDNPSDIEGGFVDIGYCVDNPAIEVAGFADGIPTNFNNPNTYLILTTDELQDTLSGTQLIPSDIGVGDFELTYAQVDNQCLSTVTEPIRINQLPNVLIQLQDAERCDGSEAFPIEVNTGEGINSWALDFNFYPTDSNALAGNRFFPANAQPGQHRVITTRVDDNGCVNSDSIIITINPVPAYDFVDVGLCSLDSLIFAPEFSQSFLLDYNKPEFTGASLSYEWNFGVGFNDIFTDSLMIKKLPSGQRAISLEVLYTSPTGDICSGEFLSKTIDFGAAPNPIINLVNTNVNTTSLLQGDAEIGREFIDLALWSVDGQGIIDVLTPSAQNNFNFDKSFSFGQAGRYDVTLILKSINNCYDTLTRTVYQLPEVEVNDIAYFADFESGEQGWIPEGSLNGMSRFEVDSSSWVAEIVNASGIIDSASSGIRAWVTQRNNGTYYTNELSVLNSPIFNLSNLDKPMVTFDAWKDLQPGADGVALQVSIDDATWVTLNDEQNAKNWYDGTVTSMTAPLLSNPSQRAWSSNVSGYQDIRYNLDAYAGEDQVRFRFILSSNDGLENDGYALDNFRVLRRNRTALVENFTHPDETEFNQSILLMDAISSNDKLSEVITLNYFTEFNSSPNSRGKTAEENTRAYFYGISDLPTFTIDGQTRPAINQLDGLNTFRRRILEESPFDINIEIIQESIDLIEVQVTLTSLENIKLFTDELILQVAVVQDSVAVEGSPILANGVVEKLLPSAIGLKIDSDWNIGQSFDTTFSWMPEDVNTLHGIVAVVQNFDQKEVYQAARSNFSAPIENPIAIDDELIRQSTLYPNPANHYISLRLPNRLSEEVSWIVYDQVGLVLMKGVVEAGKRDIILDVETLANGIFFLHLSTDNSSQMVHKFSIAR